MTRGLIFDLKEFSVHDGPGVRQTVFFKGCPLRCSWCHNPEGVEFRPQLMVKKTQCISCGICRQCRKDPCIACGKCVRMCPARARFISGEWLTSEELALRLRRNQEIYESMGGGVTFSGGEPLMQSEFLLETVQLLGKDVHVVLETSGYAEGSVFQQMIEAFDLIYLDIKLMDAEKHYQYTGKRNEVILENAKKLIVSGKSFVIRIPLIPGVTDTKENYLAVADFFNKAENLMYIELLPYNSLAGVKYEWLNRIYNPGFDTKQMPAFREEILKQAGIRCRRR